MAQANEAVLRAREAFNSGRSKSYEFRKRQLINVKRLVAENESAIMEAMKKDLNKPRMEAYLSEIASLNNEIECAITNLKSWMAPETKTKTLLTIFDRVQVHKDPLGVVLILGCWNYPINLTLAPLVGAIAAGNCCVVKPSEVSANAQNLLKDLITKYLDNDCYPVVTGGPEETKELLKHKFDHIFFTGSESVGRVIYSEALKNLTPVTLEMGGKSPLYLDKSVDFKIAVKRLLWGKFLNAGQTCIAPDYILCTQEMQMRFVEEAKKVLSEFYGDQVRQNQDFARIVNARHFKRLTNLLKSSNVVIGGESNEEDLYISPTVLIDVKPSDSIMQEEIFGPILPVMVVKDAHEAIKFINSRSKPLALYVFSSNDEVTNLFIKNTTSGSVVANDCLIQFSVPALPFGGVGSSGIGRYHGKYSFDTFSHDKPVMIKNFNRLGEMIASARYPPYSPKKLSFMTFLLNMTATFPVWDVMKIVFLFGLGLVTGILLKQKEIV